MMSSKQSKRYTPHLKFQIVVEILKGEKSVGQLARSYNLHPISIHRWKKEFLEKGPEIFRQDTTIHEYERKIEELERLIGHKEVEIALLKNFLTGVSPERRKSL
ncbi:MAG: transposase [Clostridiales bacterium]|nr:transposase [Clostridiales bacterium]